MSGRRIAVVGAGIAGLAVAVRLVRLGFDVSVFERGGLDLRHACSFAAGGMLAPLLELDVADAAVSHAGERALSAWLELAAELPPDLVKRRGALAVAHPRDTPLLDALERRIRRLRPDADVRRVFGPELVALLPSLASGFARGLFAPAEGHLDPRALLAALTASLRARGVTFAAESPALEVLPGRVRLTAEMRAFDWVVDCRGLLARDALAELRGVRGEALLLEAPEVVLERPVRLMHPRYPLYVVPRGARRYLVGATSVESEDLGPVTVRSALELLSAAYSLVPGFAEARLIETIAHARPAFPDNVPRVLVEPRLVRVNGLYRHGYLLAPVLAEAVGAVLTGEPPPAEVAGWVVHGMTVTAAATRAASDHREVGLVGAEHKRAQEGH